MSKIRNNNINTDSQANLDCNYNSKRQKLLHIKYNNQKVSNFTIIKEILYTGYLFKIFFITIFFIFFQKIINDVYLAQTIYQYIIQCPINSFMSAAFKEVALVVMITPLFIAYRIYKKLKKIYILIQYNRSYKNTTDCNKENVK